MIRILSIDPAIKTGIACFDLTEDPRSFKLIHVEAISPARNETKGKELHIYQSAIIDRIRELRPNIIAIERPFASPKFMSSILPTIERIAALRAALHSPENEDILTRLYIKEVEMVHVKAWKKTVIGNGNAKTSDVYAKIQDVFGEEISEILDGRVLSQDEADAIAIGAKVCLEIEIG